MGLKDPVARSAYMAEYQQRLEVIAKRKAYNRTPKRKAIMRKTMRKAIQDPLQRHKHEARWKLRREITQGRIVRHDGQKSSHAYHWSFIIPEARHE